MSYNHEFEDTIDNINNIAYGYGYKNGIGWANSAQKAGKISWSQYKNGYVNKVTSFGSPIFNTTRLNALCEKIATGLLLYNKYPNHRFSLFIEEKREMNLILIKQQLIDENHYLYDLFANDLNSCFDEVSWINPESLEDLSEIPLEENSIGDTRNIF